MIRIFASLKETKDLIHEGIATGALLSIPASSRETKDLIHEGIATFDLFYLFGWNWFETKDLIHEGIATSVKY